MTSFPVSVRRVSSATQTEVSGFYENLPTPGDQSRPGVQTYTGYIHQQISDFASFIYDSSAITSDKIYIGGIAWNIKICARRLNNSTNIIGFYTKCLYDFVKDDENLSNITANVEMTMKSSNDVSKTQFSRKFNETFTKGHSEWGYTEFRTIEEGVIQAHKSCVFEAKITVVRPKQKLSPEMCLQKARNYMDLAKMQSTRGNLDKAIEANEKAFTLCFEKKDGNVMAEIEAQREELIDKKLKQSIERLQKEEDAAKSSVPLKSACKHIGVLKKMPKKKINNNNQRPKIKLTVPLKPKEMKTIGINTTDTISPSAQKSPPKPPPTAVPKCQPLCKLPTHGEKVHLMISLILPFFLDSPKSKAFVEQLEIAENCFKELMKIDCKPNYDIIDVNIHFDSFRQSLFKINISSCNNLSTPSDIVRVLFPSIFPDYPLFLKEINIYIINMAIDNRKLYEQIVRLAEKVVNFVKTIKDQTKKSKEFHISTDLEKNDVRILKIFYEKMSVCTLKDGPKKIITRIGADTLRLKVYFRKLGFAKKDFLNGFVHRRKAILEKEKNVAKSFEERYERLSVKHTVVMEQYNAQHLVLKNCKERHAALTSLQNSVFDIQKHYDEKMAVINKMVKEVKSSQMQVQKCEELLCRLKKERNDLGRFGKQKLQEESMQRQKMKQIFEVLKRQSAELDFKLEKAKNTQPPTRTLSPEKAKAQSRNLQLLETQWHVATQKLEHVTFLLEKDQRYLKASLSAQLQECITQRFKKNLILKKILQDALKNINEETASVKGGKLLDFSKIYIPTLFVDEFGEI